MDDPYRYFRIEARELADELTAGLSGLRRGGATADLVAGLLRHAHTLKGAARVVSLPHIADHAHALEELVGPYRGSDRAVGEKDLERLFEIVDGISAEIALIAEPAAAGVLRGVGPTRPAPEPAAEPQKVPAAVHPKAVVPKQASAPATETRADQASVERSARASLAEIDALIDGLAQARTQLAALGRTTARIKDLRDRLGERPGPDQGARLKKIAALELAAIEVERTLAAGTERVDRELRQVHDIAERLRLVPVTTIVPDLERAARDVATTQRKRVMLDVYGDALRLDVPVLTTANDALRQIVRNAVAHGIESPSEREAAGKPGDGRIRVDVTQRAGQVVFSCTDDGRGVDLTAVRRELSRERPDIENLSDEAVLDLLMRGGVSTAPVLSEVSGRGIGLDLVRDAAARLGGTVSIRTTAGVGTTIELASPLSMTAQDVLLVDAGGLYGLPLASITESVRIGADDITRGLRGESIVHGGQAIPFLPLATLLGDETVTGVSQPNWSVLMLRGRAGRAAIGVSRLVDTAGIAIRAVPPSAPVSPLVGGVWIDVDGVPRLVLDPEHVIGAALERRALSAVRTVHHAPILVVDDSLTTRMLEQSILEAAGYQVETASSAEEGLEKASLRPYALVLVDVEMPGMDGFSFVEQTRARPELRHLPCILVTTRASAADRQRGVDAGARAHIDKGEFHQGALLTHVAELLAG